MCVVVLGLKCIIHMLVLFGFLCVHDLFGVAAAKLDGEIFTNIKKSWKKIVQTFPPGLLVSYSFK